MADHRGIKFLEIHARSGHSMGTNQESYLDQNILTLTLSGAYTLNGWVYVTPNKSRPTFDCLGPHVMERYHWLIKDLYIVPVTHFKQDGSIYPFLL